MQRMVKYKNVFTRKFISECCLISDEDKHIFYSDNNLYRLRPDLCGLPVNIELMLEHLPEVNCCLLGCTMLNCWDPSTYLPVWSYQRVDLRESIITCKSSTLRRPLKKIKFENGLERGHLSTKKFCKNNECAKASCNRRNIIPQTKRQNQVCCKTWEDDVEKRMLNENFIGHITTVVTYQPKAEETYHSLYKVLYEEYSGKWLQLKCYLIYDVDDDDDSEKDPYYQISLNEVENRTGLKFVNSYTRDKLARNSHHIS